MEELQNLTPHEIAVCDLTGNIIVTIPPSGFVARVGEMMRDTPSTTEFEICGTLLKAEIPIIDFQGYGSLELVDSTGHKYMQGVSRTGTKIVSRLCFDARPDMENLVCPGPLVRDSEGKPIGCKGLIRRQKKCQPSEKYYGPGIWDKD